MLLNILCCYSVAQSCPTLWPHVLQHARPHCPSPSPEFAQIHELVMPFNHLILRCPLLPLPLIFPSIRDFSNESSVCIRWPEYWSFSFSISPSSEYSGLISLKIDWFDLAVQGTFRSLLQRHSLEVFCLYSPALTTIRDHWGDHSLECTDLCRQSDITFVRSLLPTSELRVTLDCCSWAHHL